LGLQPTPTINAADQADAQPRRVNNPLYNGIHDPIPTVNLATHMNTRQRRLKSAIFLMFFGVNKSAVFWRIREANAALL
jgi:hypothetical protein